MANFPSNNAAFPGSQVDSRSVFYHLGHLHSTWWAAYWVSILIEMGLFESGLAQNVARYMLGLPWLLILGAFMLVGWFATRTAQTSTSLGMQYFAYAMYVVVEALIFVPLPIYRQCQSTGAPSTAPR